MKGKSQTRKSSKIRHPAPRGRAEGLVKGLPRGKPPGGQARLHVDSLPGILHVIPGPAMLSAQADGRCVDANSGCLALFGLTRKKMFGLSINELASLADPQVGKRFTSKLRKQGFLCEEPLTIRTTSGQLRHVLWSAQHVDTAGEKLLLSMLNDVTELRRIDASLGESLRKYEEIFDNIQDLYYEIGMDGTILELSPSLEKMSRWKRRDLIGKSIVGLYVNPVERNALINTIVQAGALADYEISLKDKTGKLLHCSINARLVRDEKGAPHKIIGSMRDISRRKRVEDQLRQNEEQYRSVVDNIGIGVALISPKMEILTLNSQMKQWFPHVDPSLKPVCYKSFNNPPRRRVCSYCPTFKTLQDGVAHEAMTETPMGNVVRNFRIISTPIMDRYGNVAAAIEMVEDVTEKRQIQERLQESERWYRTIFETTSAGTVVIEEDLTISYINKAFEDRTGLSKSDVEGKKKWTDFIPEEDLAAVREFHLLRLSDPSSAPVRYETRYICREGKVRDVLATVAQVPGTRKSILSLMDIARLKRVERSLKEREEELSIKSRNLEELNAALRALLKQRDEDRVELEENVLANVKNSILPLIEKLHAGPLDQRQGACLETLEAHLRDIISPFLHRVTQAYFDLTPQEVQVARYVKDGMTSKEIAERLGVSTRTVDTHRDNIREKLGIKNRRTNLRSFLLKFS